MTFDWNEAAIKKLRTLVADGLPTSEIARRLKAPSRNSVIGKCARLGLKLGFKKWPAEDDATLRQLWAEGWSTSQIASKLKLQSGSISWRAAEIGLPPRRQGSTLKIKPTVSPVTERSSIPWDEERDRTLGMMWLADIAAEDIARELGGATAASVRNRGLRLELPQRARENIKRIAPTISPVAAPSPVPEPVVVVPLPAPKPPSEPRAAGPLHFLDGEFGRCRFPSWGNEQGIPIEDKFICGAPAGSSAYCPEHRNVCFGIGSYGERSANKMPREAA